MSFDFQRRPRPAEALRFAAFNYFPKDSIGGAKRGGVWLSNTRGVKFHRLRFVEEFFENDFVQTFPSFLLGRHFRIFHEYRFFVGHLPTPTHNIPTPKRLRIARWCDSRVRKGGG